MKAKVVVSLSGQAFASEIEDEFSSVDQSSVSSKGRDILAELPFDEDELITLMARLLPLDGVKKVESYVLK